MRRLSVVGLVVVVAGCGSHHHARAVGVAKPSVTLPPSQVAAIERHRRHALLAAHVFRDRALDANRAALDSLPVFPGAVLEREVANPEYADEPRMRFALRRARGIVFEDDVLLAASGWGTFRIYSLAKATAPRVVRRFYLSRLRPRWRLVRVDRDRVRLRRANRCLWFRVPATGARVEIGTDVAVRPLGCLAP
jgi:hypothetical protein